MTLVRCRISFSRSSGGGSVVVEELEILEGMVAESPGGSGCPYLDEAVQNLATSR